MACEYCEGDRNMLAVTSTYTGMTADETLIESLCILPASPNEKPIRKHVIYGGRERDPHQTDHLLSVLRAKAVDEYAGRNAD